MLLILKYIFLTAFFFFVDLILLMGCLLVDVQVMASSIVSDIWRSFIVPIFMLLLFQSWCSTLGLKPVVTSKSVIVVVLFFNVCVVSPLEGK